MRALPIILAALPSTGIAQPLITAYRAEAPPVIDGVLDDACWGAALAGSHFLSAQGEGLAEEQTHLRVCWDAEHLYLGVEALESLLEPRLNMLHLVKAEKTGRDARVFDEDCIEIFLQPGGDVYYQFAANSGTGTYDAQGTDAGWNCDWQCAAKRTDRSYIIEAAIPLAALGSEPTGEWSVNVTRHRSHAKQYSTWSGLQGAFHQPEAFGRLRFARTGPSATPIVSKGGYPLVFATVIGGDGEATLEAGVSTMEKAFSVTGRGLLELGVEMPAGGDDTVTYGLKTGERMLLVSAPFPPGMGGAAAELELVLRSAEGNVFLNGEPIELEEERLALRLDVGMNVLAVEAARTGDGPAVDASLTHDGRTLPVTWLARSEEPPAGWAAEMDEEGWKEAEVSKRGAWVKGGSDRAYLVSGIYAPKRGPQHFPKMEAFHVPRGSRQLMRPYLQLPQGAPTTGYRMVVEAPSALKYIAVDPLGGGIDPVVEELGRGRADDIAMTRHGISYDMLPGQGMELSMRWGDGTGHTLTYQPTIATGGTFDWRHLSMKITAPTGAVSAHPLIIKWQNRGITGTFWVDNLVFRSAGNDENLLSMGSFDEPAWGNHWILKPEGPDGSKCVRIVSTIEGADKQQALWVDQEDVVSVEEGKEYVVELDGRCENLGSPNAKALCGLLFEAPKGLSEGELPIYTYCETLGGAVRGLPMRSTLRVLPPLKNVRPKRARISPCYYGSRFTNPEVGRAYADNCYASGITWTYGKIANDVVEHLLPRGHQVILSMGWEPWGAVSHTRELLDDNADVQALGFDGKRIGHTFCPTWMLAEGEEVLEALEEWLLGVVNSAPYSGANWDLEQPVIDPPTFCVCLRCRLAFRAFAGLPPDGPVPEPESILADFPEQWTDFRCTQNAEMAGHLKAILQRADRPIEFSLYSGYESKRTKEHYGVDWALMAPHLDFAIAGYGGTPETIQATIDALDGVPFMGGEMWYLSDRDDTRPMPRMETWRNRILRQFAASGGNGCLIWYLPPMEGGAFYATSEATEIIAEYEDFFSLDQRCDEKVEVTGLKAQDWSAFEHEGNTLVMLLNFMEGEAPVAVTVGEETRDATLEPFGVEVLVFE